MIQLRFFPLLLLGASLLFACCGNSSAPTNRTATQPTFHFQPPQPPFHLDRDGQIDYLRHHYWDRFDFGDTLAIKGVDTAIMVQHFGLYTMLISKPEPNTKAIEALFKRAASSRPMLDLFLFLAEQVLHDPNSPMRNDELYIPVLEAQLATDFYDEYERIAPAYDLAMAKKNRIGQPANDLRFTTADGQTSSLYKLKAERLLIFFNNPDCAMCKELREQIGASPRCSEALRSGRLKILALYPDEDLDAWHRYRPNIPNSWINSYDKGCRIREEELYQIDAIPSLYLLDEQKRVLVKDATDVQLIEHYL